MASPPSWLKEGPKLASKEEGGSPEHMSSPSSTLKSNSFTNLEFSLQVGTRIGLKESCDTGPTFSVEANRRVRDAA